MAINLPNQLSIARIILSGVLIMSIVHATPLASVVALVVFMLAGVTDYWDGAIARRTNQKTELGAFLDPLADKCLMLGAFWTFVVIGVVPLWMVSVITLREVAITLWRVRLQSERHVGAIWSGKQKTVSQFVAISTILVALIAHHWWPAGEVLARTDVQGIIWISMAWTVAITVFSGLHLVQRWQAAA